MKTISRCILAFALSLACAAPALAAPDERLKAAAEAAQPALIETLHEMVLIESGSGDVEGLAKMAAFTETRLKALGAKTGRRKTTRGAGADMVIGTFTGSGSKKLMPIGHMDTVYQKGILAAARRSWWIVLASPASATTRVMNTSTPARSGRGSI
jgi:glutamate carboxypeptidase